MNAAAMTNFKFSGVGISQYSRCWLYGNVLTCSYKYNDNEGSDMYAGLMVQ